MIAKEDSRTKKNKVAISQIKFPRGMNKEDQMIMNGSEKKLMEEMGVLWDKQARLKNKLSKHNQKGELSSRDIDEMNHITEDIKSCLYSSMELVNDQKNILLTLNELLSKDEKRLNRRQIGMALEKPAEKKDFKKKINPSSNGSFFNPNQILPKQFIKYYENEAIEEEQPELDGKFAYIKNPIVRKLLTNNPVFNKYNTINEEPIRTKMPLQEDTRVKLNLWTLFKNCIGKDITKITLPVSLCEPLSLIHKQSETMEYYDCFKRAANNDDKYLRMALVLSTGYMSLSQSLSNSRKTFNSLLGETFEFDDGYLRIISEQVSHHPPIFCHHSESKDFVIDGSFFPSLSVSFKGIQGQILGTNRVHLKKYNETYSLKFPTMSIKNVFVGQLYKWFSGKFTVRDEANDDLAVVNFTTSSKVNDDSFAVKGEVTDSEGKVQYMLEGKWNSHLDAVHPETNERIRLVTRTPLDDKFDHNYYYSPHVINLNNLHKGIVNKLPPTDNRFRTDMKALEYGDFDLSGEEKHRLEESQRARRRYRNENNIKHEPLWFEFEMRDKEVIHKYKGGYWECRETGHWPNKMLDLYN